MAAYRAEIARVREQKEVLKKEDVRAASNLKKRHPEWPNWQVCAGVGYMGHMGCMGYMGLLNSIHCKPC
jgi:hypothetical protein